MTMTAIHSPEKILKIKQMIDCGSTYNQIKIRHGVGNTLILSIKHGKYDDYIKDCVSVPLCNGDLIKKRLENLKLKCSKNHRPPKQIMLGKIKAAKEMISKDSMTSMIIREVHLSRVTLMKIRNGFYDEYLK
ncbi:MAG: hypothetical protein MUO40_02690 [Anaerolineaceae bacterium]|nr:hypothetical protein [Anaerolineaceae bacterium]